MRTQTGLDVWIDEGFAAVRGQRVGLVTHQAAIASDLVHNLDHFLRAGVDVGAVFGPQHGVWGHTQDNMIEWEGYRDERTGLPFYSLYGETREPFDSMLAGLDRLVFDVQDVGTRVYTFVWTLAYCLKACGRNGIPLTVLDRPNPIGGAVEGPLLDPAFASFVGLHPCPLRHGRTLGEMAMWMRDTFYPNTELEVIACRGWQRDMMFEATGLPWVPPSPNMPTVDTAVVYPGMVLIEGTNLSEGRGTTRPFETLGAPWLDPWRLCDELNGLNMPGVWFRPITFQPTFHKHAGQVCGGAYVHVTDRATFRPVEATARMFQVIWAQSEGQMRWNDPPYEYEDVLAPIDILWGSSFLRSFVEERLDVDKLRENLSVTLGFGPRLESYS